MTGFKALLGWARASSNAFYLAVLAGVLATVALWDGARINKAEQAGRTAERAAINQAGSKADAQAMEAHLAAQRPGAADRLRARWCRDCQ